MMCLGPECYCDPPPPELPPELYTEVCGRVVHVDPGWEGRGVLEMAVHAAMRYAETEVRAVYDVEVGEVSSGRVLGRVKVRL